MAGFRSVPRPKSAHFLTNSRPKAHSIRTSWSDRMDGRPRASWRLGRPRSVAESRSRRHARLRCECRRTRRDRNSHRARGSRTGHLEQTAKNVW
jgi:hypothetical protein